MTSQQENIDTASDHPFSCRCEVCLKWWVAMGDDVGSYGPFTPLEVLAYIQQNPPPMADMKPCPFCAFGNIQLNSWTVSDTDSPHIEWAIICQNCGAQGPNDLGASGAAEMWNLRRPTSGRLVEA